MSEKSFTALFIIVVLALMFLFFKALEAGIQRCEKIYDTHYYNDCANLQKTKFMNYND